MLVKTHIILGLIFSLSIYLIFHIAFFEMIIIFLSSFLIDFDHYLIFLIKHRRFSIKKSYVFFKKRAIKFRKISKKQKNSYKMPFLIFHNIEFFILLFLLGFFNKLFFFVLIGICFHMFLDYIDLAYHKFPVYFKVSLIWTYLENRKKKKHFF